MPTPPTNPGTNDPWATGGRESYSHESHYVDPKLRANKSSSVIFCQILRCVLFFAILAYGYHYYTTKLQP
jgi:hypothetical protein